MRAGHFTYELDEMPLRKDLSIIVYGSAEISWTYNTPDRDIGETCGYEYEVEGITISAWEINKPDMALDPKDPLYRMIEERLYSDDYQRNIIDEIEQDDE